MQNYNVVKQIGKGAFSNVHLCKKEKTSLFLSGFLDENNDNFFIIKEINIDLLVQKYMVKSQKEMFKRLKESNHNSIQSMSITPYKSNKYKNVIKKLDTEETYYYKRLCDLIDSEIEILKKLDNGNIIKYFSSNMDTSNGNRIYCIKMEYCEYGDLYTILKDNKNKNFTLRNTLNGFEDLFVNKFLKDTVTGLKYLHDLNIIHRDIKLNNVLVTKDTCGFLFKLSDFGFACFDVECDLNDSLNISEFEFSTSILKKKYYKLCGTPYYMAPEIILNIEEFEQLATPEIETVKKKFVKFYDKKIDLWSYGICLFELIFNVLPFTNINDILDLKELFSRGASQSDIYKIINDKIIIDENMKILLKKLLTINPSFRISTDELYIFIIEYDIKISNIDHVIIESDEISSKLNKNVIYEPIEPMKQMEQLKHLDSVNTESWDISDISNISNTSDTSDTSNKLNSWDHINKASSLIMKISIDNTFMKWLLNKK